MQPQRATATESTAVRSNRAAASTSQDDSAQEESIKTVVPGVDQKSTETIGSESAIEPSLDEKIPAQQPREQVDVASLAAPGLSNEVYDQNPPGPTSAPVIDPVIGASSGAFGMRVYGQTHLVTPVNIRGLEGGVLATYSVSPRWELAAGIGYGHYNNNGLVDISAKEDRAFSHTNDLTVSNELLDTAQSGTPVANFDQQLLSSVNYDTARLLTEKMNYIHVPMMAGYRLTRSLWLDFGVRMAFLVSAPPNGGLEVTGTGTFTGNPQPNVVRYDPATDYLKDENVLRSFDVAPVVGLRWAIGDRFALSAQANIGLIPYIDRPHSGDRDDYNRSLSLGLSYRIF